MYILCISFCNAQVEQEHSEYCRLHVVALWTLQLLPSLFYCFIYYIIYFQEEVSQEEVKIALLSALLLPLRAVQSKGKKGKTVPIVPLVIAESMKWPKKYATLVQDIQAQAPELLAVSQTLQVHMLHA